jgi:hypothetical protein
MYLWALLWTVTVVNRLPCMAVGHAMAQTVGGIPLAMEVCVQTQATPCGIDGGQSEAETGSSLSTLVFPCHYHSTRAPGY